MKGPAYWWKKIRFRVLLFGLIMSIVPFLLLGIWNANSSKEQLIQEIDEKNQLRLERATQELQLELERMMDQLVSITRSHPYSTWQEEDWLAFIMTQIPQIERITYLNDQGFAKATVDRWDVVATPEHFAPLTTDAWQQLVAGSIYYGDVYINPYQKPLFSMAIPLFAADQTVAAAIDININIRQLLNTISVPVPGVNSSVYLLDGNGKLLAHSDQTRFLYEKVTTENQYANWLEKAEPIAGTDMFKALYSTNGKEQLAYYREIPHLNWIVVVEHSRAAEMEAVERLQFSLTSSAVLIAFFVAALSFFFANRFSRPIEVLEKGVQRVRAGDYTYQIEEIEQRDEIGRLVESFNQMTAQLRKQNESLQAEKKRLDQVVSGLGMGLILFDEDRNIIWVNKTIERWFGVATQLVGQPCHQGLGMNCPIRDICHIYPFQGSLQQDGKEEEITSVQIIHGRKRIISHRLFQLEGGSSTQTADRVPVLEVLEDVTNKKEMEMMVRQADKLSAVGLLSSGVAHEINNPLNTLALYTDDLLDRIQEEDVAVLKREGELFHYLQTMRKQIDRCKNITDNLLQFSRKNNEGKEIFSLTDTLHDVLLLLRYTMKKKELELSVELEGNELLEASRSEVQQVLHNLISNAIDAVPVGGCIVISSSRTPEWLAVNIQDNGCGISEEDLPYLFDPFYSTKPVGEGTGLGMYIAYGIMERMGGSIQVQSEPNVGTTVSLLFPRVEDEGSEGLDAGTHLDR